MHNALDIFVHVSVAKSPRRKTLSREHLFWLLVWEDTVHPGKRTTEQVATWRWEYRAETAHILEKLETDNRTRLPYPGPASRDPLPLERPHLSKLLFLHEQCHPLGTKLSNTWACEDISYLSLSIPWTMVTHKLPHVSILWLYFSPCLHHSLSAALLWSYGKEVPGLLCTAPTIGYMSIRGISHWDGACWLNRSGVWPSAGAMGTTGTVGAIVTGSFHSLAQWIFHKSKQHGPSGSSMKQGCP